MSIETYTSQHQQLISIILHMQVNDFIEWQEHINSIHSPLLLFNFFPINICFFINVLINMFPIDRLQVY